MMAGSVWIFSLVGFSFVCGFPGQWPLQRVDLFIKESSHPAIAPVQTIGVPVDVTVVFQPINVANVDETNNAIDMECIVMTSWDSGLSFGRISPNVPYITLPKDYFWLPTLNPLQSAQKMEDQAPPVVTLFSNGTIVWFAMYKMKFWCDVSAIETGASCSLPMALWAYSKDRVAFRDIGHGSFEFSRYFSGSRYSITNSSVSFVDFPFDGRVYQFGSFQMTVKEKPRRRPRIPFRAVLQWH